MNPRLVAWLALAFVFAPGCKKGVHLSVTVERGDVTGDIYRLRVNGTINGDPQDQLLFPNPDPGTPLDLPGSFGIDFTDTNVNGIVEVFVEALDQAEATVLGVGSVTVTIPEGTHGDLDATVTLAAPVDGDGDSVPDVLDNCPADANAGQEDCDSDGQGDVCDAACACCAPDGDGDSIPDADDNCPGDANPLQEDTVPAAGPDGVGDACGDLDTDGSSDLDDCAPEDGAVFPGNVDACDGADSDCVSGVCAFDLAGLEVYDLAVSSAGRVGVTLDGAGGAGMGAFRTLDGNDPTMAVLTTATVDDPRGVAVNVAPEHTPVSPDLFYVTDPTAGLLRDYSADFGTAVFSGYPISGAGNAPAFSPFGELAFAPLGTMNSVVVFDPCEMPGNPMDCYEQAGNSSMIAPMTIDLATSSALPPNPGLGLDPTWRVRAMALRAGPLIDTAHLVYMIFDGQPAIVALVVNPSLNADSGFSGQVPTPPSTPARALYYTITNDRLLVTAGDGTTDGALLAYDAGPSASMTGLLSTTTVPGAGVPSCPSGVVLGTNGSDLYVADACNDVVWEGSIDPAGLVVTLTTAHPVCASPSHLGVVNGPGGDIVYVGCSGALGVVGSD